VTKLAAHKPVSQFNRPPFSQSAGRAGGSGEKTQRHVERRLGSLGKPCSRRQPFAHLLKQRVAVGSGEIRHLDFQRIFASAGRAGAT